MDANDIADPSGLTVLEAVASGYRDRPMMAKAISRDRDGAIHIAAYGSGYQYNFHLRRWADLAAMMTTLQGLERRPYHCLVRGAPVDGLDLSLPHRRLIYPAEDGTDATLQDVPRIWCALDFDKSRPLAGVDWHSDPQRALELLLERDVPECFRNVDCVASFTSSQGFKEEMRWRAFFLVDQPIGGKPLKAILEQFNKAGGVEIDLALAGAGQPHYTASPIFRNGVEDPLPDGRVFVIERSRRRVVLPAIVTPPAGGPTAVRRFTGKFPAPIIALLDKMKRGESFHQEWTSAIAIWIAAFGPDVDPLPLILAIDDILRDVAVPLRGQRYRDQAWRQMPVFAVQLANRERLAIAADKAVANPPNIDWDNPEKFAMLLKCSQEETARQQATAAMPDTPVPKKFSEPRRNSRPRNRPRPGR